MLGRTKKQECCRKQGRPQLRCEYCVRRDHGKTDEEEKWREKANNESNGEK